jgi:hypothetical protein
VSVVPRVLDLTEAMICDLQLTVLIRRRKCTTVEESILLLHLLELVRNGGVVLIVCSQTHARLHDSLGGVMLLVEQVLRVLGHRSHAGAEVRALEIRHSLKALLPHGIFLILNQEKHNRHHGGSGEATLIEGDECDVSRLLDCSVGLTANDDPCRWILLVEGYRHAGLTYVHAIGHRQTAAVDRDFLIVTETEECIVKHSQETRAMLAYGTKSLILYEEGVRVVVHVHLKTQPQKHY